jgi:tRNA nucleotidyltransferase (CCA-adding enzyme)
MALLRRMVDDGEVDELVAERVWQELSRALLERRPSRFLEVLRECGALARLLPEVDRLWGVPQRADYHPEVDTGVHLLLVLDCAAAMQAPLTVRVACLLHDLGKGDTPPEHWPSHHGHEGRSVQLAQQVCDRLRVPADSRELALLTAREHGNVHRSGELDAAAIVRLLDRCDAWRRPQRFAEMLWACECDMRGRTGFENRDYPPRQRLAEALRVVQQVDTAEVAERAAERGKRGPEIGRAVQQARVEALKRALAG